jgi:hypothetical protein
MKDHKRARCKNCTPRTLTTTFAPCRAHAANEEWRLANAEPVAPTTRDTERSNNNVMRDMLFSSQWNWVQRIFRAVKHSG